MNIQDAIINFTTWHFETELRWTCDTNYCH